MFSIIIDIDLATQTSLEQSIIISHIYRVSRLFDIVVDNKKFVEISEDYLKEFFIFWDIKKTKRIINECIKNGFICKLSHPKEKLAYYGLTEKALNLLTKRI